MRLMMRETEPAVNQITSIQRSWFLITLSYKQLCQIDMRRLLVSLGAQVLCVPIAYVGAENFIPLRSPYKFIAY